MTLDEAKAVMKKLSAALKEDGIFYVSFMYGTFSGEHNGRFITDVDERAFEELLKDIPKLTIDKVYITEDVRLGRKAEKWLIVLLKKG